MTLAIAVVVVARGVLAGTFGAAAWSKFRNQNATSEALVGFGLSRSFGLSLVLVETFTAFGLVMERRTAWSAYVACALLAMFIAFVVRQLIRGDHRPCPCFGVGAITPTGVTTLVRNVALLAVAAVATGPLASGQPRGGALTVRQTAVWIVAVVTALVVTHRGPAGLSTRSQRSE